MTLFRTRMLTATTSTTNTTFLAHNTTRTKLSTPLIMRQYHRPNMTTLRPTSLHHQQQQQPHIFKMTRTNQRQMNTTTTTTTPPPPLSPRKRAALEEKLLQSLNISDPILNTPLRRLGWIRDVRLSTSSNDLKLRLAVTIYLPTGLYPHRDALVQNLSTKARECLSDEYYEVDVVVTTTVDRLSRAEDDDDEEEEGEAKVNGCRHVKHVVAVYSCKGGVGKSTVAVNVAYALAKMGGRVGLLDTDIYGPSLPLLIEPNDLSIRPSPLARGMVYPITHEGVKLLSLGFVNTKSGVPGSGLNAGAAVMRGPMATKVVHQLLYNTDWGPLDILLLDLPPGTGDIPLSICQMIQPSLSGTISVTTPSPLAVADAKKGVEMFETMGIPTLGLVQNMAYMDVGTTRVYPFGRGDEEEWSFVRRELMTSVPLIPEEVEEDGETTTAREKNESDCPYGNDEWWDNIAQTVAEELLIMDYGDLMTKKRRHHQSSSPPMVSFEDKEFDVSRLQLSVDNQKKRFTVRLFGEEGAVEIILDGLELRLRHPKTGEELKSGGGEVMGGSSSGSSGCGGGNVSAGGTSGSSGVTVDHHSSSSSHDHSHHHHHHHHGNHHTQPQLRLFPAKIDKKGKYGYVVDWADGATVIYSMTSLATAAIQSGNAT